VGSFESVILSQLMGGGTSGLQWASAVYLLGLLVTVLFRPQQIHQPGLFRVAYLVYAASIILPALVWAGWLSFAGPGAVGGMRGMATGEAASLMQMLMMVSGPTLFGVSVVCLIGSLVPHGHAIAPPPPPQKHPLD